MNVVKGAKSCRAVTFLFWGDRVQGPLNWENYQHIGKSGNTAHLLN